jgi:hypothetical protein
MVLPVDPERLRREFPELTDDDLDAYVTVTKRILAAKAGDRPRLTREVLEKGRQKKDDLSARYVAAVDKMQRSTVRRPS